ncbi:Protein N-acetyltransferase, RimJ/RimL family [Lentzea xinjiangensis]|uniref:Protein N-acetyltransferase, RimJ/RimL family n=1 Tax=Lentzea xinjiangensis TaxID=402600 RepID=A0A1H9C0P2_9PSEU|nr:GNAT family N-acetyltransferase [Lentzea xinjiangensis]SEP94567.1 Protein N-acetyltransferase, RimJ/RimL family [Lentzea xinjiangensis]
MEPVEINAGEYYLRAFRSDDRIDDGPAVAEAFADPETGRHLPAVRFPDLTSWREDVRVSWAVCDATTAELLAGVVLGDLDPRRGRGELTFWTQPAHRGAGVATTALTSVLGFAFGGLGLHRIVLRHAATNTAARRVAEKCGFTLEGRLRDETIIDDQRVDELLWSRLSTDPPPEQLR